MSSSAKPTQLQQDWRLLSSEDEVNKQKDSKEIKNKLIVVIFNYNTVPRFSVELDLKEQHQKYEDTGHVKFFKCNILEISDDLPGAFDVTDVPTFIFFRNGTKCGHLTKPTKKDLFDTLDQLSTPPPPPPPPSQQQQE